jgi:cell division protein FtsL
MTRTRQPVTGTTGRRRRHQPRLARQTGGAVFLCIAVILVGLLLYLWPQMRMIDLKYRLATLQKERRQLLQAQEKLHVELATLRQLSRIEDIALHRLNMRWPRMSQIIYVRSVRHGGDAGERP